MTERRRVPVDQKRRRRLAEESAPPPPADCSCPHLDRDEWHDVESDWSDITFLRGSVNALLGVPIGYDAARTALLARAGKLRLSIPEDGMLVLGAGRFRRPLLVEVEGADAGARGVYRPGGAAYTRLVEAPWGEMRKRVDEMRDIASQKYGRRPDDLWVWYLTCRICSRERNFETLLIAHYRE